MKWETMKLSDCCNSIADGDHQPPPKTDSGIPFVTIANINSTNQFDFTNTMYVPQSYYDNLDDKRKAQKGDVLYSVVGSFGIPVLIRNNRPFVFQRHIAILRPNQRILSEYLYYSMLCKDFYYQADSVALGAAQRTISLTALRNMKITIPNIETQERIVNALSAYDNLIENNQKQIKLLEEAAQRLYKEWFVDLRFPGHETTPIVNGIPEGWNTCQIDSLMTLHSGFPFRSFDYNERGRYSIITIKNVNDGQFDPNNSNKIIEIPEKMPDCCLLKDGDILLSLTGNIGRVCLVYGDNLLLNQRVAKIQCDYAAFAYCLFRSKDMYDAMNSISNGVAQQNLSPIKTAKIEITLPSSRLLSQFEKTVNPLLLHIISANRIIQQTKQARDRLLPKLMNREIEV